MKQTHDNNFDSITPMSGSIPSPAASMSNMSNPNKFIKLLGGRDRGRKVKGLKISAGQPGSGSPWSLFEDQALVVLVHDMGPNWELVSDAVNSTLQFKCIFRKPKECKERHKILMDRSASDGADSAEDSGSSQSYPSTLPGIPKGSARQLFQCLQGPMVEDTLKSHFEKIIIIGQKQHYRRSQNDNQDPKQIATVHNSHVIALTQAFPNNLNGSVLTPLDLCDTTPSSPDVLPHGYQGSHAGGLTMSNQGAAPSLLPTSGPNSSLQGSSGMVLGGNLQSPPGPLSASARDGRFGVPRASLPTDDHQRIQQYNQMLSGRNILQSNMSFPGALSGSDHRGARINGMGMMSGMNRNMPMARPGFQGMPSSSMLNSGGMISSSMVGMPSTAMHSGAVSGQGSPMMRPREAMHMMRPGHNSEHQRQMMSPDQLPMQMSQGNSPGIAPINGLNAAFSNQTTSPPVQTYPGHTHQIPPQQPHMLTNPHHPHLQVPNHAAGSQQQAYAIRIAKERQQQRYLQQQQQQPQQFAASNSLMPHAQPQPQHPISPSLPNSNQVQSQTASQPLSLPPITPSSPMAPIASQHQQKHHMQSGLGRNPQSPNSGLSNQMGKQRQRQAQQQQFQQSGRHHPQQRQLTQTQQQAKLMKGVGRGNQLVHQNLPIDPSHLNGLAVAAGTQSGEKGEPIMHPMQNQAPYSGSGLNSVQPSKPLAPQKPFSGQTPSKQLQPMPSHSDSSAQGQAPPLASGHTFAASHQAVPPTGVANHQQQQPQPKPDNQTQPVVQRMLQQNRQVLSDQPGKAPVEQSQDQQFASNAPQAGTASTVPQTCVDSSDPVPVVSSAVTPQWKASEATNDSGAPNTATQVPSVGSDPIPPVSQGLGQRQLSSSLPPHGHSTGTQKHQQPQLQQSSIPPPHSTQQHYQPHEQPSPQLQEEQQLDQQSSSPSQQPSQQQTQHLPSGQGSLYIRPTTSKLEGSN